MNLLQEAQATSQKKSALLSSTKWTVYSFILIFLVFQKTGLKAQEAELSSGEIQSLINEAYSGDLDSFEKVALYHWKRAFTNEERSLTSSPNLKMGYLIIRGMQSRFRKGKPGAIANYWDGRYLFQAGKHALAFSSFKKSVSYEYPGKYYSYYLMGTIQDKGLERGVNKKAALFQYEEAAKSEVNTIRGLALFSAGKLYLEHFKNPFKAKEALEGAVTAGNDQAMELLKQTEAEIEANFKILDENPTMVAAGNYYYNVWQKTAQADSTIGNVLRFLEDIAKKNRQLKQDQKTAMANFQQTQPELGKPRSEFETSNEYKARIKKFRELRQTLNTQYDDSIKNLLSVFTPFLPNKRFTEEEIFVRELEGMRRYKKLYEKYRKISDDYSPELRAYPESNLKEMEYDAENELFSVRIKSQIESDQYNSFSVLVPRAEAQAFKENQESHRYYFFFDELKAIVVNNEKVYLVLEEDTWHSKINCEGFDPKLISDDLYKRKFFDYESIEPALVNGIPYQKGYFKNLILKDAVMQKLFTDAGNNEKFEGRKTWKSKVTITYSDTESKKVGLNEVSADVNIEFINPNYLTYPNRELLDDFYARVYEVIEGIEVTLRKQACRTLDTEFTFEITMPKK